MKLIKAVYYSWDAEVVFVTSNFQGNREVMEGCKEAGIPAFVSLISATDLRTRFFLFWFSFRARFGTFNLLR